MNVYVVMGVIGIVGIVALLFVGFQLRDRLEKIADLLEKSNK
jgi:hypothetical protein